MAKFKVGDKVAASYESYVENGKVSKVVEVSPQVTDYYVVFSDGHFDIFEESELKGNPY